MSTNSKGIAPFTFEFGTKCRVLFGGPYTYKYPDYEGIKMAAEIDLPCFIDIPTRDFSIPTYQVLDTGLRRSLMSIARNKPLYVGCAGGIGRTGLFFGALSKLLEVNDPVSFVRENFKSHAIETDEQQAVINKYIPTLKTRLVFELAKVVALAY